MSAKWNEIKKEKFPAICALCNKRSAVELAHMPLHKRYFNSRRAHKMIDVKYNAVPICLECKEFSESREGRVIAVEWLREQYQEWDEWYDSVPQKVKERFW